MNSAYQTKKPFECDIDGNNPIWGLRNSLEVHIWYTQDKNISD